MIQLPYKIIAVLVAFIALSGAFFGYGHIQYAKGVEVTTAADNTKIDRLKLDAAGVLAKETARANTAERDLQAFKNNQELKDADNQKTVSDLAGQLRRAAGVAVRLRDPNAAPGCRLGSSGTTGQSTPAPSVGADNGAEAGGLLSKQLTEFLLSQAAAADAINNAYQSCRADSLNIRAQDFQDR